MNLRLRKDSTKEWAALGCSFESRDLWSGRKKHTPYDNAFVKLYLFSVGANEKDEDLYLTQILSNLLFGSKASAEVMPQASKNNAQIVY